MPKKIPTRNVVGRPPVKPPVRQQGQRPVRPYTGINNGGPHQVPVSTVKLTPAQRASAEQLKATVKGATPRAGGGGTGIVMPDGTIAGGNPSVSGGHSVRRPAQAAATATPPTVRETLDDYAEAINGRPVDAESYNSWTAQQKYDYAEAVVALNANQALGGLPVALNAGLAQVARQVNAGVNVASDQLGSLASDTSGTATSLLQSANSSLAAVAQQVTNLAQQTGVGGTKGTPRPIDRSEANKRAWETRKKLYGTSGQKAK